MEARILAEKALSAASTKEQRAELAAELEQLQASRLAAVVAKKQAVKQKQLHGAAKLLQYRASKQLTVGSKHWQAWSAVVFTPRDPSASLIVYHVLLLGQLISPQGPAVACTGHLHMSIVWTS